LPKHKYNGIILAIKAVRIIMKKILTIALVVVLALGCVFAFAACNDTEKVKVVSVALTTEKYAFAVNKSNGELLARVNEILNNKKAEIEAIKNKYLEAGDDLDQFGMDIATESTNKAEEFVVATNLEFAPFEYTVGNKIAGIDMEIAKLIADELGKKLVVIHMEFDAVVTSVQSMPQTYDIAMAGLTVTPDRAELVDFTNPYFDTTQVLIVKESDTTFDAIAGSDKSAEEKTIAMNELLATLTGDKAKCGGQKGTTSQYYIEGGLEYDGFENLEFKAYTSAALAVNDMLNGNIAFVVVDQAVANAIVASINSAR